MINKQSYGQLPSLDRLNVFLEPQLNHNHSASQLPNAYDLQRESNNIYQEALYQFSRDEALKMKT